MVNQFVLYVNHVAVQVNPTFLVFKKLHKLNVPKDIKLT